jgi:hypothetical protein
MPHYTAVLDACVLVPVALADTLLRVAEKGLYHPLWSDRILAEAQAATEEIHPGMDAGKRFAQMREAFEDAHQPRAGSRPAGCPADATAPPEGHHPGHDR